MSKEAILAVGTAGVGKTTQFLTLPGRKFAYIFDPNCLASLRGLIPESDYACFIADTDEVDLSIKTLRKGEGDKSTRPIEPHMYNDWVTDFERRLDCNFFDDYDWIMLDSYTTFSDMVMDRAQFLNKTVGKQPEQADWAIQMNTIKHVTRALMGLGLNLYATAHIEIQRDEAAGRTYGQIVLTGKLRVRLPLQFSQIYAFHCQSNKEKESFVIQTRPDRENPVIRTTIPGLSFYEDVTIDWKKPVEGQGLGRIQAIIKSPIWKPQPS